MKRGKGKILALELNGGIASVTLKIRGRELVLHADARMTLDSLTALFQIAPPPAPPTDVTGKRIAYLRDGAMLLSIGPAE